MLIERYNEKTKEFECFNSDLKFITFTGYGKTKEKAKVNYFLKGPKVKNNIINVGA